MFSILGLWSVWWNVYFLVVASRGQVADVVQVIMMMSMLEVAFAGWFGRMSVFFYTVYYRDG